MPPKKTSKPSKQASKPSKQTSKPSKDDTDAGASRSKLKPATSINVRHILCQKHSDKERALARLVVEGHKFDDVARDMSEDKGKQGKSPNPASASLYMKIRSKAKVEI
jgi:NIMA-interacting peptidyl-prolyl cis-trans isomerase 4